MKKILMVGADFVMGGIPAIVDTIISNSVASDLEFHVTVSPDKYPTARTPQFSNATIHHFDLRYSSRQMLERVFALRKLILENNINVLHLHAARAGLLGVLASVGLPVKVVYTGHGWRSRQLKSSVKRFLILWSERFIGWKANRLTFLTPDEQNYGLKNGLFRKDKGTIIATRLDGENFQNISENNIHAMRDFIEKKSGTMVVGALGRLHPEKGPNRFIDIAQRIIPAFDNVDFCWVGDGELRPEVESRLQALQFGDRLRFPGSVTREFVPAVFKNFDLFICSSDYESLPISIIEAHASGVPVLCHDFTGADYFVDCQKAGRLFSFESFDKLAQDFYELLFLKDIRANFLKNSSNFFLSEFSDVNLMVGKYIKLYYE